MAAEPTKTKENTTQSKPENAQGNFSAPKKTAPKTRGAGSAAPRGKGADGDSRNPRGRNERPRRAPVREKSEFDQEIIGIRRVTRVVKGGRRFSFSVAVVIGDRNGRVGVGIDKGGDTALAIEKAVRDARKNMITVKRDKETHTIPHESEAKYGSTNIVIRPAPGRGIVAGSAVRTVFELAGIRDVGAKVLSRSKNKINIARATIKALQKLT